MNMCGLQQPVLPLDMCLFYILAGCAAPECVFVLSLNKSDVSVQQQYVY
jgi:hypothetical protein